MPYWIVLPIFLNSTPGAQIDIALSRHSLVTYGNYTQKANKEDFFVSMTMPEEHQVEI